MGLDRRQVLGVTAWTLMGASSAAQQKSGQMADEKIVRLLERKQEIDALTVDRYTQTQRWLVDAIDQLLRDLMQLRTELRDNGIIR
jgi:hypothetical protein